MPCRIGCGTQHWSTFSTSTSKASMTTGCIACLTSSIRTARPLKPPWSSASAACLISTQQSICTISRQHILRVNALATTRPSSAILATSALIANRSWWGWWSTAMGSRSLTRCSLAIPAIIPHSPPCSIVWPSAPGLRKVPPWSSIAAWLMMRTLLSSKSASCTMWSPAGSRSAIAGSPILKTPRGLARCCASLPRSTPRRRSRRLRSKPKRQTSRPTCFAAASSASPKIAPSVPSRKRACAPISTSWQNASPTEGSFKATKINQAIGRLKERYPRVARYYRLNYDEPNRTLSAEFDADKHLHAERLDGCYLLKTSREDLSGDELWRIYILLPRAENAFRDMKSPLAERPIWHHLERRTDTHIFLCVLAYHLLISIEKTLLDKGVHTSWATVRDILKTHQICTVVLPTDDGSSLRIRKAATPDPDVQQFYRHLDISPDIIKPRHTWAKSNSD